MDDRFSLAPYLSLLRAHVGGQITSADFEARYLRAFKEDMTQRPNELYVLLDRLFADVDAFVGEDDLRDQGDLDESELRAATLQTLTALERFEGSDAV